MREKRILHGTLPLPDQIWSYVEDLMKFVEQRGKPECPHQLDDSSFSNQVIS